MSTRRNNVYRGQKSKNFQGEGSNWVLIAGGALLSTLSIRLCYKLKQALDSKKQANATDGSRGNGTSDKRLGHHSHSHMYPYIDDNDSYFNCIRGAEASIEIKHHSSIGQLASESAVALPLITVSAPEFNKENGVIWSSSPDRLEVPPPRQFIHHSTCSADSPSVSEAGSDIFSKREVIQKLRQQLKRRDDMIMEMQDQILELQNSLNAQAAHSSHLQAQLDASNQDLFDSEREIQKLRKAIADHCVGHVGANENRMNGHTNGYLNRENSFESLEKGRENEERIEMLKREIGELKEVIEGKEYLVKNYKEQKVELSSKIKELQRRLDSQLPNIL